jgi:hypothetical protein
MWDLAVQMLAKRQRAAGVFFGQIRAFDRESFDPLEVTMVRTNSFTGERELLGPAHFAKLQLPFSISGSFRRPGVGNDDGLPLPGWSRGRGVQQRGIRSNRKGLSRKLARGTSAFFRYRTGSNVGMKRWRKRAPGWRAARLGWTTPWGSTGRRDPRPTCTIPACRCSGSSRWVRAVA